MCLVTGAGVDDATPVRVVLAEDEMLLREGLTRMLVELGLSVLSTATDADELLREVHRHTPDLVVTDIRMPPTHTDEGLRAAVQIRSQHPGTAVVVLSQYVQRRHALELLQDSPSGVGYLLKQRVSDLTNFGRDLHRVARGGTALDPEVVSLLLHGGRARASVGRLTPRQLEVLGLMAQGRSNSSIAQTLNIAEKSVAQHASNIYEELDLGLSDDDHRRVLAVVRYLAMDTSS